MASFKKERGVLVIVLIKITGGVSSYDKSLFLISTVSSGAFQFVAFGYCPTGKEFEATELFY